MVFSNETPTALTFPPLAGGRFGKTLNCYILNMQRRPSEFAAGRSPAAGFTDSRLNGSKNQMRVKDESGWSLPIANIFLALVIIAALVWGWDVLLYIAAALFAITILAWLTEKIRHVRSCPDCLKAKASLKTQHEDWQVWTESRSHRATEAERAVIAVFYRKPGQRVMPSPYKLFSVYFGSEIVTELSEEEFEKYAIRNYK